MTAELIGIFTASVLGSWHCAAMCGPFALVSSQEKPSILSKSVYHLGRLTSYLALTTTLFALSIPAKLAGVGTAVTLFLVVAWAMIIFFDKKISVKTPSFIKSFFKFAHRMPNTFKSYLIGVSSSLLPCVWLYGFVVLAAGRETIEESALWIIVFWSGTLPALFLVQFSFGLFNKQISPKFKKWSALAIAVISLTTIFWRSPILGKEVNEDHSCHEKSLDH